MTRILLAAVASLGLSAGSAPADTVEITFADGPGGLVVTGAGSIDLSALTFQLSDGSFRTIDPARGRLILGPTRVTDFDFYGPGPSPASPIFGDGGVVSDLTGDIVFAGTGDGFGFRPDTANGTILYLPAGYVSGTPIAFTQSIPEVTVADLGIFAQSDLTMFAGNTISLQVVAPIPLPATAPLLALALGWLGWRARRGA